MSLYLEHFGLNEAPFRITPHTDFFFDGADRGATLEALLYATLHEEGIVKVIGEVGSGKTMLCRMLIERLPPQVETVYLANPSVSRDEVLLAVADELKVEVTPGRATGVLHALQDRLIDSFARGRRTVVLIDEAHAMPEDALEQVRLLSNLETSRHKLLQIVLFGQSELDAVLDKLSMRQLKDRITHSFRTRPLSAGEVAKYVSFRMRAAGYRGAEVFAAPAVVLIARASNGLTRRINILADKALLAAFGEGANSVGPQHVRAAVQDSEFASRRRTPRALAAYAGLGAMAAALAVAAFLVLFDRDPGPPTASAVAAPPPAPASATAAVPPAAPAALTAAPAPATASPPVPAQGDTPPAEAEAPLLGPDKAERLGGYTAAGFPLLTARLRATREKLASAADRRLTLELYISEKSDPARVERFLQRARALVPLEHVYIVPVEGGGRYRVWAIYGDFPDLQGAVQAARHMPPKYQQAFPLAPLTFEEVRRGL